MNESSVDQYIKAIAEISAAAWHFQRIYGRIDKTLNDAERQKFKS